jgi:drug/metabolite transporter (DMT)-like permease
LLGWGWRWARRWGRTSRFCQAAWCSVGASRSGAPSAAQRGGLFRSRWFSVGLAVAVAAWGLHVGALALAPLSVVQAVLSGGLVFLAVLAERYFGFHLGRRQWVGVTVTAAGLAVIAITGGSHAIVPRHCSLAALIAVECGVFGLVAALIRISMRGGLGPAAEGLLLGVAAGVLFGVSDIALKYLPEAYTEDCAASSASGHWRRSRLRCWRSTPRLAGSSWVQAWP